MTFMIVCLLVGIVASIVSYMDFKIGNKISGFFGAMVAILNFVLFLNLIYNI
jgi:hypothetical protein